MPKPCNSGWIVNALKWSRPYQLSLSIGTVFWQDTIGAPNSHIWREIHLNEVSFLGIYINVWGYFYFQNLIPVSIKKHSWNIRESVRNHIFAIAKSTRWIFEKLLFLNRCVLSMEFVLHLSFCWEIKLGLPSQSFLNLWTLNVFQIWWWVVGPWSLKICYQYVVMIFFPPYKTGRYLEGTKRNPGKIISRFRFPCLDLVFERKTWKERFCQIRKNHLVVCMIHLLEKRSDVMVTGEEQNTSLWIGWWCVCFFLGVSESGTEKTSRS